MDMSGKSVVDDRKKKDIIYVKESRFVAFWAMDAS